MNIALTMCNINFDSMEGFFAIFLSILLYDVL